MTGARPVGRTILGGPRSSHFHLPAQFLLGLISLIAGSLYLLKQFGRDYLPFIPEKFLMYICALGCVIGGIYMIITHIWKPRLYI